MAGRPSKLNEHTQERLLGAIKAGCYLEAACAYAGISYRSFRRWMQKGEAASSGEYCQFWQEVTRAIAESEISSLAKVRRAADEDWRAAAWILERRFPERWANTQRIKLEVEKELEQFWDSLESTLSAETYQQILEAVASGYPNKSELN